MTIKKLDHVSVVDDLSEAIGTKRRHAAVARVPYRRGCRRAPPGAPKCSLTAPPANAVRDQLAYEASDRGHGGLPDLVRWSE